MQDFYRRPCIFLSGGAIMACLAFVDGAEASPEAVLPTLPGALSTEDATSEAVAISSGDRVELSIRPLNPFADKLRQSNRVEKRFAQAAGAEEDGMAVPETPESAISDSVDFQGEGEQAPEGPATDTDVIDGSRSVEALTEPSMGPTVDAIEGADVPAYLTPSPNPLEIQTRPEEVEIVGSQPLDLETAIAIAYQNNQELQIALLSLQRNQAALREAQAALYPTVDLGGSLQSGNAASINDIITGTDEIQTIATGSVDLSYDLGLSGQRSAQIKAAEAQLRSSELDVEVTQEQLRLDTINDYYALQEAIEQIRINQAFLDEAERNLRDAALREEVGVGTRFDVLRAEVQVANARQAVTQSISSRQTTQRQLALRLNVPPSIDIDTLPVEVANAWPLTLEESIVQAFQNRAELEQFLAQRTINQQQRKIALSTVRPNVSLFASYDMQQFFSGTPTGLDAGFNVGAQLQWRLFDGGAAAAAARQEDSDVAIAEEQFSQTRNAIRFDVEQSYFSLESNLENITTAKLAVAQAKEALELSNLRFNAGVGTQLDVLTATGELAEAEGNLVTAILNYNRALASMERAVSNVAQYSPAQE